MSDKFRSVFALVALTFILILFNTLPARGEIADPEEMQNACRNWLSYIVSQRGSWGGSAAPQIISESEITAAGEVVGRFYAIEPVGYVIVPILKELAPIKAYSDENDLDINEIDGFAAMIREVLSDRNLLFVQRYGALDAVQPADNPLYGPAQREMWNLYALNETEFNAAMALRKVAAMQTVGPLLTTVWHQSAPYNNFCPIGDGGRTVVGCVATAAAQILAYHRWPMEGTGTRTYWWNGDNSCDGYTPGMLLTADFTDPYDWDNIPNNCSPTCSPAQQNALAELNYEVGVAFSMDYGRCGSGAYTSNARYVFPDYFRYLDIIELHDRNQYGVRVWSDMIKAEIEADRPIQYKISLHSIVCDGWQSVLPIDQVHMNYGWGGGNNSWYTIDDLYCNWEGCSPTVEQMLTKITPDRGVFLSADTTWGYLPLDVCFTGSSTLPTTDQWIWAFGDGDSAYVQSPVHTYSNPGRYDVTLKVVSGADNRTYRATKYITILADTLSAADAQGTAGTQVEVIINVRNTVPLRSLRIPVTFEGDLGMTLANYSFDGCRTSGFDQKTMPVYDPSNSQGVFYIFNTSPGTPDLAPGYGPVLKLYFNIPAGANATQLGQIKFDGFSTHFPIFAGPVLEYTPKLDVGLVSLPFTCGDANGNSDISMLDATFLLAFLFRGGPSPAPIMAGDANGSGTVNILDATYLITYLYKSGPAPACP
ncbi:MAG: C10 family peptidase [Candidatus Zixiibacteriota bacterium]